MGASAGERRVVSVLIADVVGSTAIAERLGPERSKFLFDEVVRRMSDEIRRYEGTIAQLTGDGVYALFGAPVAHEADSERAVRAGLGIHDALAEYSRDVAEAYDVELHSRVAVNTGPVVVPAGHVPLEQRLNALGDTVNVAARLQSLAGPGGVVVGSSSRLSSHACSATKASSRIRSSPLCWASSSNRRPPGGSASSVGTACSSRRSTASTFSCARSAASSPYASSSRTFTGPTSRPWSCSRTLSGHRGGGRRARSRPSQRARARARGAWLAAPASASHTAMRRSSYDHSTTTKAESSQPVPPPGPSPRRSRHS